MKEDRAKRNVVSAFVNGRPFNSAQDRETVTKILRTIFERHPEPGVSGRRVRAKNRK
jgi:hypothetical protein